MNRAARGSKRLARGPLQIPDVRRMWVSDLLSVLGDHAAIIALAVLVYSRSHSAILVAVTSAAAYVPAFGVGPLLATFADRFSYRRVLMVCDLFRALAYLAILIPGLSAVTIISLVFAAHCATFPFNAARAAQLPQIAGNQYGAAQRLSQSTLQIGMIVGYAMGGTIVAIGGAHGAIAIDAISFVVSAAWVARVQARARTDHFGAGSSTSAKNRLRSGARTIRTDPLILWPAVMVTTAFVGVAAAEAMAVVVARQLRPSSPGGGGLLAVLLILPVVVTLASIAVCPSERAPRRLVRLSAWMAVGSHSFAFIALLLAHRSGAGLVLTCMAYAALGVSNAVVVPCVTVVGQRLPSDNRASVFSLLESLLAAGQAVGALVAGVAVSHFGVSAGIGVLLLPAIFVCGFGISRLPAPAARHSATEVHESLVAA